MAFPNGNIDLFDFSEKTLSKINELGKVKLNNFDLSFHFSKDNNPLDAQLNFYLHIFEEEFSKTVYSKKYNSIDKMIKLMLTNIKDEYMYQSVKDGLVLAKIKNLKNQLFDTLTTIKSKLIEYNDHSNKGVLVDIDELSLNKKTEKNGMPFFAITAKCLNKKINIKIPLASNASDWEQKAILKALTEKLGNEVMR